ncbi:MAG: hypothetical protein JJU18_04930, partial [Oceanicaulis sp.]|nr:hypothetical protein [Oceanicaulis sp.]
MTALIRTLALTTLLTAALTLAPGAFAGELRTVVLKDRLITTDGVITLGDLFDNAGEAGEAALARAPAPRQRQSLATGIVRPP